MSMDLSVIITAHREGPLLPRAIASARAAITAAADISCELLVVLNRADGGTREGVRSERSVSVDFDDVAEARMAGAAATTGRWIAFLDADDLFGETWLRRACVAAAAEPDENFVLHPALSLAFGLRSEVWPHVDSTSAEFRRESLLARNAWTALAMVPRSLLLRIPQRPARAEQGFGFEDWHWNCETLAAGARHRAVPETAHFVRVRPDSRGAEHRGRSTILAPTSLAAEPDLLRRLARRPPATAESQRRPWLALETKLRRLRDGARLPEPIAFGLRASAGVLNRLHCPRLLGPRLTLPDWAQRETMGTAIHESELAGFPLSAPCRDLTAIHDPEALAAFARWTREWTGQPELAIGRPAFLRRHAEAPQSLELRAPLGGFMWPEANQLVLTDARLGWLARAIAQARPQQLTLEPGSLSERLIRLHGMAFRVLGIQTAAGIQTK